MNPMDAVRSMSSKQWFSNLGERIVPLDLALQRRTGGRVALLRLVGMPYVLLTTTGRKSGQPRSVPLQYTPHRGEYVVVASNWGKSHHPAWSANLLDNPDATVWERGEETAVRARLLTDSERDEVWAVVAEQWPAYDAYAERAGDREIRLFALTPKGATSAR